MILLSPQLREQLSTSMTIRFHSHAFSQLPKIPAKPFHRQWCHVAMSHRALSNDTADVQKTKNFIAPRRSTTMPFDVLLLQQCNTLWTNFNKTGQPRVWSCRCKQQPSRDEASQISCSTWATLLMCHFDWKPYWIGELTVVLSKCHVLFFSLMCNLWQHLQRWTKTTWE